MSHRSKKASKVLEVKDIQVNHAFNLKKKDAKRKIWKILVQLIQKEVKSLRPQLNGKLFDDEYKSPPEAVDIRTIKISKLKAQTDDEDRIKRTNKQLSRKSSKRPALL